MYATPSMPCTPKVPNPQPGEQSSACRVQPIVPRSPLRYQFPFPHLPIPKLELKLKNFHASGFFKMHYSSASNLSREEKAFGVASFPAKPRCLSGQRRRRWWRLRCHGGVVGGVFAAGERRRWGREMNRVICGVSLRKEARWRVGLGK